MRCDPVKPSPEEFELTVKSWFDKTGKVLTAYESCHRGKLKGSDGTYEIDVTLRFEEFGSEFTVLCECKHHKNPVKREAVQILYDRLRATGSHKGILVASTSFQSGAIKYAKAHGIALIQITDGRMSYVTKSHAQTGKPPSWVKFPEYVGWLTSLTETGAVRRSVVSAEIPEYLSRFLSSTS